MSKRRCVPSVVQGMPAFVVCVSFLVVSCGGGGTSTPPTLQSISVPPASAIDPNESFLYVVCGDQTLRVFTIDYFSGGVIAQVASVPLAGQPSGLTVEPKGRFVYTSDSTGVSAFSVNPQTGALAALHINPPIALTNTTGVYAGPSGQYLYVTTGAQNVQGAVFDGILGYHPVGAKNWRCGPIRDGRSSDQPTN